MITTTTMTESRRVPTAALHFFRSNAFLALCDQGVVSGASFVIQVFLGRLAGPEELGVYTLGFTLLVLIICLQDSLVMAPYTVFNSRLPDEERPVYAGTVLIHHGLWAVLAASALAVASVLGWWGIGQGPLTPLLGVLAVAVPFVLLREFQRRLAFAHFHFGKALALDSAVALLQVAGLVGLGMTGLLTALGGQAVVGAACAVGALTCLLLSRRHFTIQRRQVWAELGRSWAFGKWVVTGQLVGVAHGFVVYWLLAWVLDTTATGTFAACMTVVLLANPFILGISNILGPGIAHAFTAQGRAGVRRAVLTNGLMVGGIMSLFVVTVVLLGDQALEVLYSNRYAGHESALFALGLAVLAGALAMVADHGLRALERPEVACTTSLAGLFLTTVAALALMPTWGVLGASWGYLAGSLVSAALRWLALLILLSNDQGGDA